jgi:NAD-dependent deacetylase
MPSERALATLADRVRSAARLTVLTGAGVSAASGVPTFRGPGGLWRSYRAADLATPEAFAEDPGLVWEWYDWRRQTVARAAPNPAHFVLAAWDDHPGFTLITQNVDGLHERAGSRRILRFHGSIWEVRCATGCAGSPAAWLDETVPFPVLPPPCPYCSGIIRPNVVWFGEPIHADVFARSFAATGCNVFLTIGTSALVYPAAALILEARRHGAWTAEINVEDTPASSAMGVTVRGKVEEILVELDQLVRT